MEKRESFLKTTLIGGLIFLIPFVIILAILGKALKVMILFAEPIAKMLPIEAVAGIAVVNIVAFVVMVLLCFLAGLFARSKPGKRAFNWLDLKLTSIIPGYSFVKELEGSMKNKEEANRTLIPVIIKLDDQAQVGYEVERLDNGLVAVFLPSSPDTWSGMVAYMTDDRVERLNTDFTTLTRSLRTLGRGSQSLFKP